MAMCACAQAVGPGVSAPLTRGALGREPARDLLALGVPTRQQRRHTSLAQCAHFGFELGRCGQAGGQAT